MQIFNISLYSLLFGLFLFAEIPLSYSTTHSASSPKTTKNLFSKGENTFVYLDDEEKAVVQTAFSIVQKDIKKVFDADFMRTAKEKNAQIIVGTVGQNNEIARLVQAGKINLSNIKNKWEAFLITTVEERGTKKLVIAGSDSRGTAYGLLEISRLIGVSPWEWWADAAPNKRSFFPFPDAPITQSPSVQYRGIFLNDEDWGLRPWSSSTFEPEAKIKSGIDPKKTRKMGTIGPKTYEKIFELLLRLRANTIWPAMHEVTVPFYFTEGNREMADRYGIIVGTSHCEPLARNSATEWDISGNGPYNYITNKDAVISYWTDRLKELKGSENIFTVGMRGKHDGRMEGVETVEEYKLQLTKVLADQQELLKKYINPDPSQIPQVLIPYKEVLEVYDAGVPVPDQVTLIWPDDNYGYIRHFPNENERKRAGGNGVYYHVSYWGSPHDYLWLGTANPALIYQQMKLAYEKGARKMWIVNVGDIKPLEYQTELFLDIAWDIQSITDPSLHLQGFLDREFGKEVAGEVLPMMLEYYRLSHIRKPEFLGNSRVYEKPYENIRDLPWSENQIRERLAQYDNLSDKAEKTAIQIPAAKRSTFYELIQYPIQAATQMNRKMLYAQLARHGKANWENSQTAFDSIIRLTHTYNQLHQGKWNHMMDFQPRRLPVFDPVKKEILHTPLVQDTLPVYIWNGADCAKGTPILYSGLGYAGKAAGIEKNAGLTFTFDDLKADSITIEIRLLPSHAVSNGQLRFSLSIDSSTPLVFDYETKELSEEWKENVLRNQSIRKVSIALDSKKEHQLTIKALDEGVVLDQVLIFNK